MHVTFKSGMRRVTISTADLALIKDDPNVEPNLGSDYWCGPASAPWTWGISEETYTRLKECLESQGKGTE